MGGREAHLTKQTASTTHVQYAQTLQDARIICYVLAIFSPHLELHASKVSGYTARHGVAHTSFSRMNWTLTGFILWSI